MKLWSYAQVHSKIYTEKKKTKDTLSFLYLGLILGSVQDWLSSEGVAQYRANILRMKECFVLCLFLAPDIQVYVCQATKGTQEDNNFNDNTQDGIESSKNNLEKSWNKWTTIAFNNQNKQAKEEKKNRKTGERESLISRVITCYPNVQFWTTESQKQRKYLESSKRKQTLIESRGEIFSLTIRVGDFKVQFSPKVHIEHY